MSTAAHVTPSPMRTAHLALSLLVLVSFALAFGYLMARALAVYQPAEYTPRWGDARWIGGEEAAATRYFRRRFVVQGVPDAAYLVVGGIDELAVYVNGTLLAASRYFGARVTEILDLRRYLVEGENLVAVRVSGQRWASRPLLIARLVLQTAGGARRELGSDPAWKVSAREMRKPADQIDWTAATFDDLSWPHAVAIAPPDDIPDLPLDKPEALFAARTATWNIWSPNANPQATLVRDLEIPGKVIRGAWLEVGLAGQYTIAINGRRLHSQISSAGTAEVFATGRYLLPGLNRLELNAETVQGQPRLYARLLVETDKGKLWVSTDGRWLAQRETPGAETSYRPVQLVGCVGSRLQDRKAGLVVRDLSSDEDLYTADFWSAVVYAAWILLAATLTFPLFHVAVRDRAMGVEGSLEVFVQPFLFGLLLMGGLILVDADLRLRTAIKPGLTPLAVTGGLVASWLTLILLEASLRRWRSDD